VFDRLGSLRRRNVVSTAVVSLLAMALVHLGCRHNTAAPVLPKAESTANDLPNRPANPPHKVFISPQRPLSPAEERASFTLPEGFEIQLVAAEPDIQKPMQLAFDERGRLLASCSRDYPLGPKEGEAPGDSVFLIEVDGTTGAATSISTFSSGYNICSGIEALPGGRVILAHAPEIQQLTDIDGDGVADESEVLYTGFARWDTHELPNSFTWGIDGWLYGLQGHVNESNVKNKAGESTPIHHGNVYRMQPDGSIIEVWARGMSNPWGLAFDGEQTLFAADCESRPIWQIVEGLPYQGFLQDEEPLGFAPFITEDPHGASGFAGLVSYTARAFPEPYRNCLYMGSPITGIIYRDQPVASGSTKHLARRPDFLTSTDAWFRPVDIELGPDGALYIADWYNNIIAHVEVPLDHPDRDKERGRIWRVVYRGSNEKRKGDDRKAIAAQFDGPMATDWSTATQRELFHALDHANAWIRRQAAAQLLFRFPDTLEGPARNLLRKNSVPDYARLEAFWLLHRNGAIDFEDTVALTNDESPLIRRQAVRALARFSSNGDGTIQDILIARMDDSSPVVAREAAMALRLVPSEASLWELLDRQADIGQPSDDAPGDTLLAYAQRFALRDHLRQDAIVESVATADNDQTMQLLPYVVATQTEKATELQATWLEQKRIPATYYRQVLENILARGREETLRATFHMDIPLESQDGPPLKEFAHVLFSAPAQRSDRLDTKRLYQAWFPLLAESGDPDARRVALSMAAGRQADDGLPLARIAVTDRHADERLRQTAAQLLLNLRYESSEESLLAMVANPEETASVRRLLAYELAARASTPERFERLRDALNKAPAQVQKGAVESLARQRPGVIFLLEAVERGDINPVLLNDVLVRIFVDEIHKDQALTAWHRRLVERVEDEESRANAQITKFRERFDQREPNLVRGQELVEQYCLLCHRIGGFGALRAPNLDGIGNRGVDRLLQDILQPSKDIDPAFRSTIITTNDGRTEEGFVTDEDETSVSLVDSTGWESSIRKSDIKERKKMWVSPMPPDFGTVLPEEDFLDILGFLLDPPARIVPLTEAWKNILP